MMKKVIFIVHTEYHLIEAISCIYQFFPTTQYTIVIYKISPIGSSRLTQCFDFSGLDIQYKEIRYTYQYFKDKKFKESLNLVAKDAPDYFIFFLESLYWIPFLLKKIKHYNRNTKIVLAPDGANVYVDKIKGNNVKIIIKSLLYRLSNLMLPPLFFKSNHYASLKEINIVYVENPSAYINYTNKQVQLIKVLQSHKVINIVQNIFRFKGIPNELLQSNLIVLFDTSFENNDYLEYHISILKQIAKTHPNCRWIIKPHPNFHKNAYEVYSEIENVYIVPDNYPAELYISYFSNAIFLSLISTAFFCYNDTCRYYWLYPLYEKFFNYSNLKNPTSYIKVVNSIDQIL